MVEGEEMQLWLRRRATGLFRKEVELMCVHVHLLFSFAAISPVSLEHTCWGCSVSCKQTHKCAKLVSFKMDLPPVFSPKHKFLTIKSVMHDGRKDERGWNTEQGKRKTEGELWVHPGWLMSCWRIIPTWARREWEGDRKGESEKNGICWSGDDNLGRGAESLSPQPPGEGERRWWWGPPSGELLEQIM